MEACKTVILDGEGICNLPASFEETALERTGGTVKLPQGVSFEGALEPLLESSKYPGSPFFLGRIMLTRFPIDKFYMATQTVIENLVSENPGPEFPLVLCKEELNIIKNYKTPTLILGRSGTGKTTCLVYKLVGRYLAYNSLRVGRPRRQVLYPLEFGRVTVCGQDSPPYHSQSTHFVLY